MRLFIILVFLTTFPFICAAHESNQAYFKIEHFDDTIVIHADFPWTIRNALLKFAPELKSSRSKEAFDTAFFEYLKSTVVLIAENGKNLKLIRVDAINNSGNSHQNEFSLTYLGKHFKTLQNSTLFDINTNQINFHSTASDAYSNFETTRNNPIFIRNPKPSIKGTTIFIWTLSLVGMFVLLVKKGTLKLIKL